MIRALIADDHAIVRQGLRQIVAEAADIVVAGEASTGSEVMDAVRREHWDIVILDVSLPDRSGLEVLKFIKREYPQIPVLILTMHEQEQYALRALRGGASGYMTKDGAPSELLTAIRRIASGGRYVTSTLAEKLTFQLVAPQAEMPHGNLSDREFQILCLLGSGKSVSEIAETLFLSIKTVSTYKTRIMEKMSLRSTAELIHYAIVNRLTAR